MAYQLQHGDYLLSDERSRLNVDVIHRYLAEESYWARGAAREIIECAVENSLCIGAYTNAGEQIGLIRAVTDYATFAWICDVFVLEPHRRKGLASAMYAHAEKTLGRKIVPSELQSDAGKALWAGNAADKQFGKAEIAKSDANGTGHQPPQHPATHQAQTKDNDLAQLVDGFHKAAHRQERAGSARVCNQEVREAQRGAAPLFGIDLGA